MAGITNGKICICGYQTGFMNSKQGKLLKQPFLKTLSPPRDGGGVTTELLTKMSAKYNTVLWGKSVSYGNIILII